MIFGRANNFDQYLVGSRFKEPRFLNIAAVKSRKIYKNPNKKINWIIGAEPRHIDLFQTYREKNEVDELHVFSKEKGSILQSGIYSRNMLSEKNSLGKPWKIKRRENCKSWISLLHFRDRPYLR